MGLIIIVALVANNGIITDVNAIIWIEGHITSDTIWTSVDTYRVIGNTYVDPGVTLTIEPGVHVEFAEGFSLTVEGSFSAAGTDHKTIIFTSSSSSPNTGSWEGIKFQGNKAERFVLAHSTIEYATHGILLESPADVFIEKSEFKNNSESGLHILGESNITISENTITHNGNGISSSSTNVSGVTIVDNLITMNQKDGIFLHAEAGNFSYVKNIIILNNNVSDNAGNGIHIHSIAESALKKPSKSYGCVENVLVSRNLALSNGGNGIILSAVGYTHRYVDYVRYGFAHVRNVSLLNNIASSNSKNGICIYSYGYGYYGKSFGYIRNTTVVQNLGTRNGKNGLEFWSEGETDGSHKSGGGGVIDNVVISENVFSSNNESGIRLYSKGHAHLRSYTYINKSRILKNEVSSNQIDGIQLSAYSSGNFGGAAYINETAISENRALLNKENGIRIVAFADEEDSFVQEIQLQDNIVSLNGGNGIGLFSQSGVYYVENVNIFRNVAVLNNNNGVLFAHIPTALSYPSLYYRGYVRNVSISNSTLSQNGDKGLSIQPHLSYFGHWYDDGSLREVTISNNVMVGNDIGVFLCPTVPSPQELSADIQFNCMRDNNFGVFLIGEQNNTAYYNDISDNGYGMNVTDAATINAEYNYWGDETGPYHYSLNPEGKGNTVNGNGTDLDFIPFLTSGPPPNPHPVAVLSVDKRTVDPNETVTFDATGSTDDGRIDYYFFDFGDGTNSSWTPLPIVVHKYNSEGSYIATLKAMDDFGVTSLDSDLTHAEITVISVPNPVPKAYIDLISPNPAKEGEIVSFQGHGEDSDGYIVEYIWESDKDGFLSSQASFDTSSLSVSAHTITLEVKDDDGQWSDPAEEVLTIYSLVAQPKIEVTISSDVDVLKYENNEAKITVDITNTGGYVARDVSVAVEIPYNFETEDGSTWTGDIQPGGQISVMIDTKITRCLPGIFAITGTYKDAEDNIVNIEPVEKTVNAEDWIILVDEEGWTEINVSPRTFNKVRSLVGAEDTIAALWLTTTALDLGLDDPTIEKLLEHSSSFLDWLIEFIESGEVDESTLAVLVDIVTSVGVNTIRIYMAANEIGKTTIYEDETLDYHAVWVFEALESLIGPVIDAYIQTIEWGISKMDSGLLCLTDTQGRLYLHVYGPSWEEIPVHYGNHSAVAFIPLDIHNFAFVVNATDAHESTEEYDVACMRVKDGNATDGLIFSETIDKGETKDFAIQVDDQGKIVVLDTVPPIIIIVSPEKKTYHVKDVSLTFKVNEAISWISYSLDGQANVTISGNTTLSGLPNGSHSLTVYAKDMVGNTGASETIQFTIETQQPEPFPTWFVGVAVATIAVVTAAIAVFWRKRKQTPIKM